MYLWLWFRGWSNDTCKRNILLGFCLFFLKNKTVYNFYLWYSVIYVSVGNMELVMLQRMKKTFHLCIFVNLVGIHGGCMPRKNIVTYRIGWRKELCLRKLLVLMRKTWVSTSLCSVHPHKSLIAIVFVWLVLNSVNHQKKFWKNEKIVWSNIMKIYVIWWNWRMLFVIYKLNYKFWSKWRAISRNHHYFL